MISSKTPSRLVEHRISSATAKFAELKRVLQDYRIHAKVRGRFLNAYVRSRLCYNAATWQFSSTVTEPLEREWSRMARRCVKGGFRRKGDTLTLLRNSDSEKAFDYAYKYTTDQIHDILGTTTVATFIERQSLRWTAHCARMPNNMLQKQALFIVGTKKWKHNIWTRLEKSLGQDRTQIRRIMFDKSLFSNWLSLRFS